MADKPTLGNLDSPNTHHQAGGLLATLGGGVLALLNPVFGAVVAVAGLGLFWRGIRLERAGKLPTQRRQHVFVDSVRADEKDGRVSLAYVRVVNDGPGRVHAVLLTIAIADSEGIERSSRTGSASVAPKGGDREFVSKAVSVKADAGLTVRVTLWLGSEEGPVWCYRYSPWRGQGLRPEGSPQFVPCDTDLQEGTSVPLSAIRGFPWITAHGERGEQDVLQAGATMQPLTPVLGSHAQPEDNAGDVVVEGARATIDESGIARAVYVVIANDGPRRVTAFVTISVAGANGREQFHHPFKVSIAPRSQNHAWAAIGVKATRELSVAGTLTHRSHISGYCFKYIPWSGPGERPPEVS